MVEGQHLQGEIFSRTEKENRVESLPSPNSKKFGRLPQLQAAYISATVLFNVLYYETRTCLTGRRHFMQAHIFLDLEYFVKVQLLLGLRIICVWRSCFLDLEYFMSANILPRAPTFQGADILHRAPTFCIGRRHFRAPTFCIGRRHFDVKYYFVYCRQEPIFNQVLPVCFAISLLDFCC